MMIVETTLISVAGNLMLAAIKALLKLLPAISKTIVFFTCVMMILPIPVNIPMTMICQIFVGLFLNKRIAKIANRPTIKLSKMSKVLR